METLKQIEFFRWNFDSIKNVFERTNVWIFEMINVLSSRCLIRWKKDDKFDEGNLTDVYWSGASRLSKLF